MGRCTETGWITYWFGLLLIVHGFEDGDIRLSGGGETYGRVEVYYSTEWGAVCSDHFNHNEAVVICRQLGHDVSSEDVTYSSAAASLPVIALHFLTCTGSELSVSDCDIPYWGVAAGETCAEDSEVSVVCHATTTTDVSSTAEPTPVQGSLRLSGSSQSRSGRVELFLDGAWGTVCDHFGNREAEVVCRQLGLPVDAVSVKEGAYFGVGSGQIWQLECTGTEDQVIRCSVAHAMTCHHGKDVGVICGYSDSDLPSVKKDVEDTGWRHYYIVAPVGIFLLIGWAIYARCNKKARMRRLQQRGNHGSDHNTHRRGFGTMSLGIFTSNNNSNHRGRSTQRAPKQHGNRNQQIVSHGGVHNPQFNPVESDIISPRSEYGLRSYMGHSAHELSPAYPINGATTGETHTPVPLASRAGGHRLFTTRASGGQPTATRLENGHTAMTQNTTSDPSSESQGNTSQQPRFFHYPANSAPKPPAYETEFEIPLPPAYEEIYPASETANAQKRGNTAETNM